MPATSRVKPSMGCAYVIVLLLGGLGIGMLIAAGNTYVRRGRMRDSTKVQAATGFALCVAAAGYMRFARKAVRKFEDEERRRTEFPEQPWKWRLEWCEPAIKSKDGAGVAHMWLAAALVCGISGPVAYAIVTDPAVPKPVYLVLFFPVIGVALLGNAIYRTLQWRKFGPTRLVLSTVPGSIGGYLGGVIEVPARVALERDASLVLRCIRRVTTGSGKQRQTTEDILWEREERIPAEKWLSGGGRTEIPVLFHIPERQPSTDLDTRNHQIIWRLSASAATPGVDFATAFDVPVFATGDTAPPPEAGGPALDVYRSPGVDEDLGAAGVTREGAAWRFEPRQLAVHKGASAAVALALTGLLGLFAGQNVHWAAWLVTAFLALLAWALAADLWFSRSELRIDGEEIVVREWRWRGLRERRVRRADVVDVRADETMRSGAAQYHRLLLVGRGADPAGAPLPDEPFRTRKVRYELRQLTGNPGADQPPRMARATELVRELSTLPRFEIAFAKHVRGKRVAETVRQMIAAEIRGARQPVTTASEP